LSPTTGRVAPVSGSRIVVRPAGAPVSGLRTAIASLKAPASSCNTRIAIIPPWLCPISNGIIPSCS
jgi:hypothetical protein